ncbi:hypothetical protein CBL_20207 [Carabus blaptoides fortunei]
MDSKRAMSRRVAVSYTGEPPYDPKYLKTQYTVQKIAVSPVESPPTLNPTQIPAQQSTSAMKSSVTAISTTDNNGFQRSPKRHCASPTKDVGPRAIAVSNRFNTLSQEDCESTFSDKENAMDHESTQNAKKSRTQNTTEHTFELASEKSLKVVIRGQPESIPEVKSELAHLDYPVRKVRRLVMRGKTTPLVSVDLDSSDKGKEIFKLSRMLYLSVKTRSSHVSVLSHPARARARLLPTPLKEAPRHPAEDVGSRLSTTAGKTCCVILTET